MHAAVLIAFEHISNILKMNASHKLLYLDTAHVHLTTEHFWLLNKYYYYYYHISSSIAPRMSLLILGT